MKMKTIRQTVMFRANPHAVYAALMDSRQHATFTGDAAKISRRAGGKFAAYSGYIAGTNLKLVPDRKIVQSWRGSDWPAGHFSRATFALRAVRGGTNLTFTHTGVPEEQYAPIREGWKEHYWKKLKLFLERGARRA